MRNNCANWKGFVIGAKDVHDPQYPAVVWPYMVGQRDGDNDGETGSDTLAAPPDPLNPGNGAKILFQGQMSQRTFRQRYAVVTVDGVAHSEMIHYAVDAPSGFQVPAADEALQKDLINPNIPADIMYESLSWTRMGISPNRTVYSWVDRKYDDFMFMHWRIINNGLWSNTGKRTIQQYGGVHDTVRAVMMSLCYQWDDRGRGSNLTNSGGQDNNDGLWHYYGKDYDGARTEDMRLVWVRDGDQDPSKYDAVATGLPSQDDYGDPRPITGELLSARHMGLMILHWDKAVSDRRDDIAQPMTCGWGEGGGSLDQNWRTARDGHEVKYRQMRYGYQYGDIYYEGDITDTPARGAHPFGGSWIKASNDLPDRETWWPGSIVGVTDEVTQVEQQLGMGPTDIPPNDTLNALYVEAVAGHSLPYAAWVGREWAAGRLTDAQKDAIVDQCQDSLFTVMRRAKAIYESATFPDGHGGTRFASTRDELHVAYAAAIAAGKLSLSPPAPASFTVVSGKSKVSLYWTLNTTTGSNIAGWRVYRAVADFRGDSAWTKIYDGPPSVLGYVDKGVTPGFSYYYYLTTYDANGLESTMHTRTNAAAIPLTGDDTGVLDADRALRFALEQNAPNPFNPTTTIRFSVAASGPTRLDIYSTNGQLIRTLVNGSVAAGVNSVQWDGKDAMGRPVASGTYLYRLTNGTNTSVRRMVLVR
ncbi:MAG TPA: FlgD immunoglobulin-like domain containing protein [Candidatus Latescibacteria bacterium]|nr:FlgD immunoglobulin-like domain containing protein [Candidatus Latescibacterota bacterium]HOS63121.1 FlgD immunoglobulin-like domain containing protein [Candidatus Latescibacterota bacterium]HPK74352.1 FlgD immunoglobulin-like domain containing protein [Candidatus Latescibacterota bacterium]